MKIELMTFESDSSGESELYEAGEGYHFTFKAGNQFFKVTNDCNNKLIVEKCQPHKKCEYIEGNINDSCPFNEQGLAGISAVEALAEAAYKLITSY